MVSAEFPDYLYFCGQEYGVHVDWKMLTDITELFSLGIDVISYYSQEMKGMKIEKNKKKQQGVIIEATNLRTSRHTDISSYA